jgi:hypothetical protein
VLEPDTAFFRTRCLFNGDHLPFHLGKFARRLLLAADEERSRPDDHYSRARGPGIFWALTVLAA